MRFFYVFLGAILELIQTRLFTSIFGMITAVLIVSLAFKLLHLAAKFRR